MGQERPKDVRGVVIAMELETYNAQLPSEQRAVLIMR